MTNREFANMYAKLGAREKLKWLSENLAGCRLKNGVSYGINQPSDLEALIEQEMYEKLTGRK